MKKQHIFSLLLTVCLAFSLLPSSAMAAEGVENFQSKRTYQPGQFQDVPTGSWYEENVRLAYELGLMDGTSVATFSPDGTVTKAELIKLTATLHSMYTTGHGVDTATTSTSGVTVAWYAPYVNYMRSAGFLSDVSDMQYEAIVQRWDVANYLGVAFPKEALPEINLIADNAVMDLGAGAQDRSLSNKIYRLYRAGIMTGSNQWGDFRPESNIKRSEIAALVARMAIPAQRKDLTLDGTLAKALGYLEKPFTSLPEGAVFTTDFEGLAWYEHPDFKGVSFIVGDGIIYSLWLDTSSIFPGKASVTINQLRGYLPNLADPNWEDGGEGAIAGDRDGYLYWSYPEDINQIFGINVKIMKR